MRAGSDCVLHNCAVSPFSLSGLRPRAALFDVVLVLSECSILSASAKT
jgi:hypothetical protein